MRVLIVGAGLAGPCLAHALRRERIEVILLERSDPRLRANQGYRIHIAPTGVQALRECLPDELFQLAVATSGRPGSTLTIFNRKLKVLRQQSGGTPSDEQLSVDRLTFRQVLLHGLQDTVRYGMDFGRYELTGGGVRAYMTDGTALAADLLVAADGIGSRVRRQLLPDAPVVETGQWMAFGKTPLTEAAYELVPPQSLQGFSALTSRDGRALLLAGHRYRSDPQSSAERWAPGLRVQDPRDYLMWVLVAPAKSFGTAADTFFAADGPALREIALRTGRGFHRNAVTLLGLADPQTIGSFRVRTSIPVPAWETGPVTLVGDAIHAMVPAGIGTAVALQDAARLGRAVVSAYRGEVPLPAAIADYEQEMRAYGFAAVAAAQRMGGGAER